MITELITEWPFREKYPEGHSQILRMIQTVLSKDHISNGEYVTALENELASIVGAQHAIAVSSCTLGIALALQALKIEKPLLVPGFAFCAPIVAALWNRMPLRFLPVDMGTFNLDSVAVTKACEAGEVGGILSIAVAGNPSGIVDLQHIARKYNIPLIIDAAAGLGAEIEGHHIGSLGDAVIISLSSRKLLSSCEGGVIFVSDDELAEKLRRMRTYGSENGYLIYECGINARLSEVHAAIGLSCLPFMTQALKKRRAFVSSLNSSLSELTSLSPQEISPGITPAYGELIYKVPSNKRDSCIKFFREKKIEANPFYDPPIYHHPALSNADHIAIDQECLSIDTLAKQTIGIKITSAFSGAHEKEIFSIFKDQLDNLYL